MGDSLARIQQQLNDKGWQLTDRKPARYLNWLKTDSPITQLPIPPHVHEGSYETLTMVKYADTEKRILIIRLWPAAIRLTDTEGKSTPLWLGTASYLEPATRFGVRYLQTGQDFSLYPQLAALQEHYRIIVKYRQQKTDNWDGRVLLLFQE